MCQVVGLFFALIFGSGLWTPLYSQEFSSEDMDSPAYVIEEVQGSMVRVLEEGTKEWYPAQEGQVLETGDEIKAGEESEATLVLRDDTLIRLSSNSGFKVKAVSSNDTGGFLSRLLLVTGRLLADVKKNLGSSHSTFEVETNGIVCGVRGTVFELNTSGENLETIVHEGTVELFGSSISQAATAGQYFSFRSGKPLLQRRLLKKESRGFLKWRDARKKILEKRKQRLEDIRKHVRKAWQRKHPRAKKALLRKIIHNHKRP